MRTQLNIMRYSTQVNEPQDTVYDLSSLAVMAGKLPGNPFRSLSSPFATAYAFLP